MQSGLQTMFDKTIALPVVTITLQSPSTPQQPYDSLTISVDFYVGAKASFIQRKRCNWLSFVSTLCVLETHISTINLGFVSQTEYHDFYDDEVPSSTRTALDSLLGNGKLCCGYWNSEREEWVGVTDDQPLGLGKWP